MGAVTTYARITCVGYSICQLLYAQVWFLEEVEVGRTFFSSECQIARTWIPRLAAFWAHL